MIPVARPAKPKTFDRACRRPGRKWLKANPTKPPKDLWTQFHEDLRSAFGERCGWLAMWISEAQVDHYLSKDHPNPSRRKKQRPLAYEWSNLRYASATVNNRKRNLDAAVLDPYEVQPGWFELDAALHLKVSTNCPLHERARAQFTVEKLELAQGAVAMRMRRKALQQYERMVKNGGSHSAALNQLDLDAPLLATYVRSLPAPSP